MSGTNADETGSGSCSSSGVTIRAELQQLHSDSAVGGGEAEGGRGGGGAVGAIKRIAAELFKDELERSCSSLPPLVYDGKSDLCTLGSRPGMECVPLRSPADPYHYHHVTDQTKSLQELQNEVGALLEFRDLVIETFPDLKTKMASSAANSTLTGIPSSSLASRREWEPGIRSRRKLTYKESTSVASSAAAAVAAATAVASSSSSAELHQHSSSSLIRSRSNSHSGKKEPKSGEGNNGSVVIQDSGFSTETSSSKETHSASSTTGGATSSGGSSSGSGGLVGQGTIVSNTPNRLTVDTEDELWNLLDVIHRKSNRLREEVDALQQLEREKYRTNQLNNNSNSNNNNINNHTTVVSSTSNLNNIVNHSSSSSSSGNSGSSGSSGNLPHTHQPPGVRSANGSVVVAVGGGGSLAKTFQNQLLVDIVNKDDVQILRKERDRLFDKLSEFETEAIASRIRTSKMQDEVDALAMAKRELEDQLKAALSQKLELNSRIHDLHQQFANKSAPSSPDSIKSRHQLTPGLRKHSSTDSTTSTIIATPSSHLSTSPSSGSQSTTPATHLLKPRFSQSSFAPVKSVSSSSNNNSNSSSSSSSTKVPVPTVPSSAVIAASAVELQQLEEAAELGKLDGLVSSPARLSKVRMTDSKKIAAILLETNIVELQRHLLTITVQNQVLQQRLDHATRSRIFLSKKLDKSKEDIDDLKFKLEEKTIELEGTKAQLRVLESKHSGKSSSSSGFSPEHHHHHGTTTSTGAAGAVAASATSTILKGPSAMSTTSVVVSTSAGGIVSHQHRSASTSELSAQLSPVHQLHHHQQQQQQRDLALRLTQSQVSTPSMKAMTPLAMDEILQHSSSTESAQDQAERDSPGSRLQCPETPRRRPSKIPLAGTKGYVAPKPPSGRNFMASQQRGEKSSPSPSTSLTNKSLNKSTGSLNMKSTGPSSITSANKDKDRKDVSLNRPESAQSWRRDTSLEKSRSSSIPVSKGGGGSPTVVKPPSVVSSSPLPKAKRDSLTTRVKNLDSLSRLQSAASASTGNLSKSSSKKDLSSSFTTGQLRDRKQSASAIRRVSSASIGRGGSSSSSSAAAAEQNNNNGSSAGATADSGSTGGSSGDSGKARRTNTFRLAKPTLMPPLEITSTGPPQSPRGRFASNLPIPRTPTAPALIITSSPPVAATTVQQEAPPGSSPSSSSSSSSAGSSPSSVTTITTIESHSSSTAAAAPSRDLIAEYLAAKSRSQQAPAIFNPKLTQTGPHEEQHHHQLELAYKHPILLMDEDEHVTFCSVVSSVGNERNREVDVEFVEDNSIELLEAKVDEMGEGEKESLIVPKPKMIAFHSPKASPVKAAAAMDDTDGIKCRLVGRVNPNILKTWEQLSGGAGSEKNYCEHKRKNSKNSLITVTSSENSGGDKQSCLIYYRQQYEIEPEEEAGDFRVMKIRHRQESVSESSTTVGADEALQTTATTISLATSTATTMTTTTETTSSEGCYDFYDSIDDSSNRMEVEDEEDEEEYALAAGEGLADFTSLDRKKLMWSIDVE